jgi:hypothetical protein
LIVEKIVTKNHAAANYIYRLTHTLATLGITFFLLSCGSAGGDGVVGGGGTGTSVPTVSVGPIAGFGSIVVNGVKFDDTTATVTGSDARVSTRSDLRLGMFVEVRGVTDASTGTGIATSIVVVSELKGTVADRTASDFKVLGVTVRTNANTVYDNTSGVTTGDLVEVYGSFNAVNRTIVATRIEKKNFVEHKLRGVVSGLNTRTRQFLMGTVLIDYKNATAFEGIANGAELTVFGGPPPASGAWSIERASVQTVVAVSEASRVELEAVIEQYVSLANFRLSGLVIDGSAATIQSGLASDLAVGVSVEVKGEVQSGVVRASKIKIKIKDHGTGVSENTVSPSSVSVGNASANNASSHKGSGSHEFEVKGAISEFKAENNFVIRGTPVQDAKHALIEDGSSKSLQKGDCVHVTGKLKHTASGSALQASSVKFASGCN